MIKVAFQQLDQGPFLEWWRKNVALPDIAAHLLQPVQLFGQFDPFSDRAETEVASHVDDGAGQALVLRAGMHFADEGAVNFQD